MILLHGSGVPGRVADSEGSKRVSSRGDALHGRPCFSDPGLHRAVLCRRKLGLEIRVGSITSLHTDALLAGDVLAPAPTGLIYGRKMTL